jgi:hypothetical protein
MHGRGSVHSLTIEIRFHKLDVPLPRYEDHAICDCASTKDARTLWEWEILLGSGQAQSDHVPPGDASAAFAGFFEPEQRTCAVLFWCRSAIESLDIPYKRQTNNRQLMNVMSDRRGRESSRDAEMWSCRISFSRSRKKPVSVYVVYVASCLVNEQ